MNQASAAGFAADHPRLVYGCMRIAGDLSQSAMATGRRALLAAVDAGFTHFDHADIYGQGHCESLFGDLLREAPDLRKTLTIIGKCGIRFQDDPAPGAPKRYDFSQAHIERSVNASLKRLNVDYLDVLLLHRPDYLMDPELVARSFENLAAAGKVRLFGTSNFLPSQFALLKASCPMPLVVNQVEINVANLSALENGTLDQCQQLGVVPQAWSPLKGVVSAAGDENQWRRVRDELARQSEHYQAEPWIVALAWLLRHPARIAAIVGSVNPGRIAAAHEATQLDYSRADWYRLLEARNGHPVP